MKQKDLEIVRAEIREAIGNLKPRSFDCPYCKHQTAVAIVYIRLVQEAFKCLNCGKLFTQVVKTTFVEVGESGFPVTKPDKEEPTE